MEIPETIMLIVKTGLALAGVLFGSLAGSWYALADLNGDDAGPAHIAMAFGVVFVLITVYV